MMRSNAGFTLIEVLIALAILAIGLVAVIKVTGDGAVIAAHMRRKVSAHYVAMNVLSRIQVGLVTLNKDNALSGSEKMLGIQWNWTAKVDQASDAVYERVLIEVKDRGNDQGVEHLSGFVVKHKGKNHD